MGQTLPSATQMILQEEASFGRFRRALLRPDQVALDDLFTAAKQHTAAAQEASHALPFEVLLLTMLLEEHKAVMRLREQADNISLMLKNAEREKLAQVNNTGSGFVDPGFGVEDNPEIEMEESDG